MEILIRGATTDDLGFVLATMPKALRYSSEFWESTDNKRFHANTFKLVRDIVYNPSVSLRILCDAEEPSVILAYALFSLNGPNRAIIYAYTKPPFRRQGYIKQLSSDLDLNQAAYASKKLIGTIKRHKLELNPWLLLDLLKGDM